MKTSSNKSLSMSKKAKDLYKLNTIIRIDSNYERQTKTIDQRRL